MENATTRIRVHTDGSVQAAVNDKRNVTYWSTAIKDEVLEDVANLKSPIGIIAQLHCIPETTVNMWARAAGLMKDRPNYANPRRPYAARPSRTDQDNAERHALLVGWR